MTLHPAVAAVRRAVRSTLADVDPGATVLVACSGGADSLALLAATVFEAGRSAHHVVAATVDHGLQDGSHRRASDLAGRMRAIGASEGRVLTVTVGSVGGPEAAARSARYAALDALADELGAPAVLLGHTRDDQAETVLLGLARGSGARSLAGMAAVQGRYRRPLLDVARAQTVAACRAEGLSPWSDPHNTDRSFTRVRVRRDVLPVLEQHLGPGVAEALARTARQLREDSDALEAVAAAELSRVRADHGLDCERLRLVPAAVRRRVLRDWLRSEGVPEMTDAHLRSADALIAEWRGQGGPALPGDFVLRRAHGRLRVETADRKPPNG
jgi:tRNA(Ile)-lysidine synthase